MVEDLKQNLIRDLDTDFKMKKKNGCWLCKHLEYYEGYFEEANTDGFCCEKREDVENFLTFPCNRKLKCFEEKNV